jgi:hypothetical protein
VVADLLSWVAKLVESLDSLLEPVWAILDSLWPSVVVAVGAIFLIWLVRWARLRWRGRSPLVQISTFAWAAPNEADRDAPWVTSLFREQLAALRLDALDPLPERAPGAPLVEIVEGVGQGVGHSVDIGKAVGRLFKAVWSDASYEVWGTLREEGDRCKIAVQLVDRGRGNRTLISVTLSEESWEEGARKAAMAVAGALYPCVSRRHRKPWTHWKESVPRQLIEAYHRAREFEASKCLEQAMGAYHDALDLDPLNPHLRLRIAMLQERLALDLDAWVTYQAIIDETDRKSWSGADRRVRLIALYRLAVLLGNGRIAKQWTKQASIPGDPTRRDQERDELRKKLRMGLKQDRLLKRSMVSYRKKIDIASAGRLFYRLLGVRPGADTAEDEVLRRFKAPYPGESEGERKIRAREINEVLEILSLQRLEELDAWLRIRPPMRRRRFVVWWRRHTPPRQLLHRRELPRGAIRVSKLLIRIRIAASTEQRIKVKNAQLCGVGEAADKELAEVRAAHKRLTANWPFPRTGLRRWFARRARPRLRWANRRPDAWQLHYNAACAAASVLQEGSVLRNAEAAEVARDEFLPGDTEKDKIVRRAIKELEHYAHSAGSKRVAAQADWVAIDDPDLEGLADEEAFTLWASHHLPRDLPSQRPGRNVDVNRYTARIARHGALAFAQIWWDRAQKSDAPVEIVATWWREERDAWARLADACHEFRSWRHRLEALNALEVWWQASGRPDQPELGHEDRGRTVESGKVPAAFLAELARFVGDPEHAQRSSSGTVLNWVHGRFESSRIAYESEPDPRKYGRLAVAVERAAALKAARVWFRLAEVLGEELNGSGDREAERDPATRLAPLRDELTKVDELTKAL